MLSQIDFTGNTERVKFMQKTILLQGAGILDEEAKCILKQNVYIKDGKNPQDCSRE